ncbi:hypothetical protein QQM79_03320 [Marinobacteraceae bacterium S3BR75-40.1]
MDITVEVSYYPLRNDFKEPIKKLIDRLQQGNVDVLPGRISTELFGTYEEVMKVINDAVRWSFEEYGHSVFVAKFLNGDRRPSTEPG